MLQTIRDKSQGIVAWLIIGFVCISFALWGVHNYFGGAPTVKPIVKINGQKITHEQVDLAFQRFRQQQIQTNPELFNSQAAILATKKQIIDSLVSDTLLTQAAKKEGFVISTPLLELELANMPVFQVNGTFSKNLFEQLLANMMLSQEGFFEALKEKMLVAQVKAGIMLSAFALPNQVDESIRLINQKRTFIYLTIPANQFLPKIQIAPKKIEAYYRSQQQSFLTPEKISVDYVMLSLPDSKYKNLSPAARTKLEKQFSAKSNQLANLTFEHPESLEIAANALNLPIQTTELFSRQGADKAGLTSNTKVIEAAFSKDVLQEGNNSDVIALSDTKMLVLHLKKRVAPGVRPLAEVHKQIESILRQQQAALQAKERADHLLQEALNSTGGLTTLASREHLKLKTLSLASRNNNRGADSNVVTAAFSLALPINNIISAKIIRLNEQGDIALIQLISVQEGSMKGMTAEMKRFYEQGITRSAGMLDYALYEKGLRQQATIKYL